MTERQLAAAGMLGRGASAQQVAEVFGISPRTVERWKEDGVVPGFRDEIERVRENSQRPDPNGVLLDALSARKDDGVDWVTRVKAAIELRHAPIPSDSADPEAAGRPVIRVFEREPDEPDPVPEPDF